MAYPIYDLYTKVKRKQPIFTFKSFKLTKKDVMLLLVLLISIASLFTYLSGAFGYPYLENEDPWGHSVGAKYVAVEKNAYDPELNTDEIDVVLSYIDIYPPAYNVLMGILHQTAPDLPWTLKFFNSLIISLGFIFFYLFAKIFMHDSKKALFATFVLAVIPSYLSHFIWAHSLVVTLFFPTMYAFLKISEDKRWAYVAAIMVAGIWVSQNISQPIKLSTLILLYIIVASITSKKFKKIEFAALAGGIILSLLWWGVMIYKYSFSKFVAYYGGGTTLAGETLALGGSAGFNLVQFIVSFFQTITRPGGTGSRAYTFSDFFVAQGQNMINNPIGVGIVLSILTLFGVIYLIFRYKTSIVTEKNMWRAVALIWLIYTFWGVNGQTFPVSVARAPFRIWMLMAIPISLVAAEGFYALLTFFRREKVLKLALFVIVIGGLLLTSAQQKYELNTAIWPTSGSFMSAQEPFQYGQWFDSIPDNTPVFLYSPRDKLTIGYGAYSCEWCQEVQDIRASILEQDANDLYTFLKENEYEYFVVNPLMDLKYFNALFEINGTQTLLQQRYTEFLDSGLFTPVHQAEGSFVVLKVN